MLHWPSLLLVIWACSIAYFDFRYKRIPNALSLGGWVVGMACLLIMQSSPLGAPLSSVLMATAFGLLVTMPGYVTKKLGAGDVKFMVAIGLLTSLEITLTGFVVAALSGGLFALFWMNTHWLIGLIPQQLLSPKHRQILLAPAAGDRRLAYGPFLAVGLIVSLWIGHLK